MSKSVAILGAGNGGLAAAADLSLRGHEARLFSRSEATLAPIRARGGIALEGAAGTAHVEVSLLTTDLAAAVEGADLVMMVVPSTAIESYAARLASCLQPGQPIFLNPGGTGGALTLVASLRRAGFTGELNVCEGSTLTYACRADESRSGVRISNVSPRVPFAAFPGRRAEDLRALVGELYPAVDLKHSVLETGLANLNAIEHPAQALLNTGWIEHTRGDFYFYRDGTTPGVGRVIDAVDRERLELAETMGVKADPFVDIFCSAGYTTAEAAATGSAYEALQASEANWLFRSPPSLDHRYVHEDVGHGLVPWAMWARMVGVATPTIDGLITLGSVVNGRDYLRDGLTLERMGLDAVEPDQLESFLYGGGA